MPTLESLTESDSEPNPIPFHAHPNTTFGCARGSTPVPDALTPALTIFFAKFTPMRLHFSSLLVMIVVL